MNVVAAPRATEAIPYAESQPQRAVRHASPDWLPVIGWFVDDGVRHSRINVVPLANTVDPNERFSATLKFFRGGEQPVHTFISEPFAGDQMFRYESADLLQPARRSAASKAWSRSPRAAWTIRRAHFPWVDSWLEFSADDGSLSGSVPGLRVQGRHDQARDERQVAALAGRGRQRCVRHVGPAAQLPPAPDAGAAGPVLAVGPRAAARTR